MRKYFWRSLIPGQVEDGRFKNAAINLVADQFDPATSYDVWRWWKRNFSKLEQFSERTDELVLSFLQYFQTGSFAVRRIIAQILSDNTLKISSKTSVGSLLRSLQQGGKSPWPIPESVESLALPPPLPNLAPVVSKFRWKKSAVGTRAVDLQREATEIESLFSKCVDWYSQRAEESSMPVVCAIGAGFYLCQAGWLRPYFELNPKRSDANWASFKSDEIVRLPHWRKIHNHAQRSGCTFILPNNRRLEVKPQVSCERLATIFGGMIRDVLLRMKKEKCFDKLPLRKHCYLFVDEFDGLWGWIEKTPERKSRRR